MSATEITPFWIEDIPVLLTSINCIPDTSDTLEEQMNSITRAVLLISLILYILEYEYTSLFFLFSILFIIIIYYIQRNSMKERYTSRCETTIPIDEWTKIPRGNDLRIQTPSQYRFCLNSKDATYDQKQFSENQALVGPPNPKTKGPTYVIPPPAAWDYWSENHVVPSGINDSTYQEIYQSGYVGTSTCGSDLNVPPVNRCNNRPNFQKKNQPIEIVEGFNRLYPNPAVTESSVHRNPNPQPNDDCHKNGDMVDFVYKPDQLKYNLPSNFPAGECSDSKVFSEYNKNLFTQTIEPGMYYQSEVIEPISSNIGISHTQQFEPVVCKQDKNGGITYISKDPRTIEPIEPVNRPPEPNNANVYDPRFSGYGTSYRSYVDPLTGQPRFMYDDVDAIRRPNYIVRSNIDHALWAQGYGPMDLNQVNDVPYQGGHQLAQNQFMQDTLSQRSELQERLMRKYNTQIGWQRRQKPLRRDQGGATNRIR